MTKKLESVLLLDDNLATNFLHKKFLEKSECAERIVDFRSGTNALKYLTQEGITQPDLILVDINMPIMSAWEFLEEYGKLNELAENESVVILLSTSLSPADKEKADKVKLIKEVMLKPLTNEGITAIIEKYFGKKIRRTVTKN